MREIATSLVKQLRAAGHEAVFAGGCVRDMLLDKEPKDFDIATSARPEQVMGLFPGSHAVGAHFGVIVVHRDGENFEVATFRQDGDYSDGRRPDSVVFTSAEEDAKRRDFTVNGLFYDPLKDEVLDFVGGRVDLEARVLRAIGDARSRFQEDRLRLLRAVRFATVLGFPVETGTWEALKELAGEVVSVSAERIRDELNKIFLDRNRVRGFDLLVESGLMKAVMPEVMELQGCEQPPQFHPEGDVFVHTRKMLELLGDEVSLPLVWSVLLHDISKPETFTVDETGRIRFNGHDRLGAIKAGKILRRLKFPNQVVDPTVEAVANHMGFKDVPHMRESTLKRFMARPYFEDELELHRVDCLSSNGMLDNYELLKEKRAGYEAETKPLIPPPLVTGHDLLAMGVVPGPRIGELLLGVQTLQLEGVLNDRESALIWLSERMKDEG
ncbi:CCA tRNA nucleotidyltransferase [Phragmitibacter flavus]|uniref:CCA tRNA nucleotidyltransferase n=2 Tax=Phragmitibacter flavus TaxID=2576071 RepID=A0A5R8KE79_9BACT|nr:CCA tRNA nucleotidyltransferase [Phragmitibacter flavus]